MRFEWMCLDGAHARLTPKTPRMLAHTYHVPGAQAAEVGDKALVEGAQAVILGGLHKAVHHTRILAGAVTCTEAHDVDDARG